LSEATLKQANTVAKIRNPAVIDPDYERRTELVIETQLGKAGVRLAYLLNAALK